jgi:dipeptidyl aminopeptidase/acylaminoacyl peptidase
VLYWIEGRPEGDVLVRWDGVRRADVLPPGVHVASAVHEYGGGAYLVHCGDIWFVRADDQRIWRMVDGRLAPVTAVPEQGEHRHGDLALRPPGLLFCVRERHRSGSVVNELVVLPMDGSGQPKVIASGWDFYSSPRPDLAGSRLAWITWNQPLMPWDGAWLWVADVDADGLLGEPKLVAGGPDESVMQPRWSPDGVLHFLSDRTGWWNLYRQHAGHTEPVIVLDAELGPAPWEFGYASYQFLGSGRIATTVAQRSEVWLGLSSPGAPEPERIPLPYRSIKPYLAVDRDRLAIIGSGPRQDPRIAVVDPATAIRRELFPSVPEHNGTEPELIQFPTRDNTHAYAIMHVPPGSFGTALLPLLVRAHPGPTANAPLRFDPWVAFFNGHGFAVLDVDYRGSTGYGRAYRNALRGAWGVLDVADCVDAVRYLAESGRVDAARVAICGSSAGGYTALRAVATTDTFAAAMVRHAIIDPVAWSRSAPKFQARHADLLITPATNRRSSPLQTADAITAPTLIVHGERDTVTSISDARQLAASMGSRATLLAFADEGHGLRSPDHEHQALTAELAHLHRALGR